MPSFSVLPLNKVIKTKRLKALLSDILTSCFLPICIYLLECFQIQNTYCGEFTSNRNDFHNYKNRTQLYIKVESSNITPLVSPCPESNSPLYLKTSFVNEMYARGGKKVITGFKTQCSVSQGICSPRAISFSPLSLFLSVSLC